MKTEQLYMSQNLELMFTLHPFNAAAYDVTNTAHNKNKLVQCLQFNLPYIAIISKVIAT